MSRRCAKFSAPWQSPAVPLALAPRALVLVHSALAIDGTHCDNLINQLHSQSREICRSRMKKCMKSHCLFKSLFDTQRVERTCYDRGLPTTSTTANFSMLGSFSVLQCAMLFHPLSLLQSRFRCRFHFRCPQVSAFVDQKHASICFAAAQEEEEAS